MGGYAPHRYTDGEIQFAFWIIAAIAGIFLLNLLMYGSCLPSSSAQAPAEAKASSEAADSLLQTDR